MDVFYTNENVMLHRGTVTTFGTPFMLPRIGEKVDLEGVRWLVEDVIWDLEQNQVELVLKTL